MKRGPPGTSYNEEIRPIGNIAPGNGIKRVMLGVQKINDVYLHRNYKLENQISDIKPGDIVWTVDIINTEDPQKCYIYPLRAIEDVCKAEYNKAINILTNKHKFLGTDGKSPDIDFLETIFDEKYIDSVYQKMEEKNERTFEEIAKLGAIANTDLKEIKGKKYPKNIEKKVKDFLALGTEKEKFSLVFLSPELLVRHMTILGVVSRLPIRDEDENVTSLWVSSGHKTKCLDIGLDTVILKQNMFMSTQFTRFWDEKEQRYTYILPRMVISTSREAVVTPRPKLGYENKYVNKAENVDYTIPKMASVKYIAHIQDTTKTNDELMKPYDFRYIQVTKFHPKVDDSQRNYIFIVLGSSK